MSNIFRRNQTPTGYEFWDTSVAIAEKVTRFVMNDKNVPKHYRYVYALPIIHLTEDLRHSIVKANTIYPYTPHELERRKDFQQDAINANELIIIAIQDMLNVLTHIDVDRLDEIGALLLRESALLRGWRKSSVLLKR